MSRVPEEWPKHTPDKTRPQRMPFHLSDKEKNFLFQVCVAEDELSEGATCGGEDGCGDG
jgi:hypothetical protein